MPGKFEGGYNPEYDVLPEPPGGYTKEYIEQAIKKWEEEITKKEIRRDALKLMVKEGRHTELKEDFEGEIEDLERQIKVKQVIIEKGRAKIEELALKNKLNQEK